MAPVTITRIRVEAPARAPFVCRVTVDSTRTVRGVDRDCLAVFLGHGDSADAAQHDAARQLLAWAERRVNEG